MAHVTLTRPVAAPTVDTRLVAGIGFGLIAAIAWSGYTIASRAGVMSGFSATDLTALRFIVAGLVMLPFVLRRGLATLAGIGWRRGILLALGAGPLFSGLYTYGLGVTPYAHGPVISPSVVTLGALGLAALVLGERPGPWRLIGTAAVVAGLVLVAGGEALFGAEGDFTPYDLLFVGSGLLWAGYTVLLRRWQLDPIAATAAVAVVSMIAIAPAYLLTADYGRLFADPGALAFHALMQGVVAAVVAILAFSKAVALLGAGRAGIFPSLVPVLAVVLGIPFLGEWPTAAQVVGIAVATAGLFLASGIIGGRKS
ncbi:DMT family transporter [Pontivivens ytuae]|uniref:DMT family transporter n=1 Tax=Pontivivens ytuae TaxID=2789856 RepID=A0A7S9LVQ5_9RHOB|nr:DMT family transporter [Pontivivens ytuae]QPH56051.1 DMT family transporter [Pontivivens ytuae]